MAAKRNRRVLGGETARRLSRVFKALADPTRLRLIGALSEQERCVEELTEALGMTQSAVSHQLRLLRNLELVRFRRDGRHVFYALDDTHVQALFDLALAHVEHD